MKTLAAATALVTVLVVTVLLAPPAARAVHTHGPDGTHRAEPRSVVLGGVRVRLRPGTEQVVTVDHRRGHHATVTFWRRGDAGWTTVRRVRDGRIGYGGLVPGDRRQQGTGTTPLGTYGLFTSFGTHSRREARAAGWRVPYRPIRRGDFWVQDNRSRFYNRYRNLRQGGFRPRTSERLTDYGRQYEYVVVLDFNRAQVRHRGAGIFLHVNGDGATAGCVSAPRRFLRFVMGRLDPAKAPVIAVGR